MNCEQSCPMRRYRQTDRWTMNKLVISFRNSAKAPKPNLTLYPSDLC